MARLYKYSPNDWQYDFSGNRTMVLGKQRNMATQLRDGKYSLPLWPVRRSLDVAHHQSAAFQEEEPSTRTGARHRVCAVMFPCR